MERPRNTINMKYVLIGLSVLVFILTIVAGFFYVQYQSIKKNPNQVTKAENDALVERVSKIYSLPKDEAPTIATITDKEKLKDQPFFANAQNGDKVIIYTKSKKAIIYRPSDNIIVNSGPVALDQKSLTQVALLNAGGDVNGVEKKITDAFADSATILSKTDAKNKNSVKKITVVDVTGQSTDIASKIAAEIGGEVAALPNGEVAPQGATIVIFVK